MSCQATEITAAGPTRDPLNLLRQMPDAVRKNAHLTPPGYDRRVLASSPRPSMNRQGFFHFLAIANSRLAASAIMNDYLRNSTE